MESVSSKHQVEFMKRAWTLARRGLWKTFQNPCVGAVLVNGGRVIGEGWHRKAGWAHAEIEAIQAARKKGFQTRGSTLYVTLEPCCTHGKTPPCTDAILKAGIRHVIVGAMDPNPKHQGRGLTLLRKAGVQVVEGVLAEKCTDLNQSWNHWIVRKKPWVIAKSAMTLDGKIATSKGESKWITSKYARQCAHQLRSSVGAILVGIQTVLKDDPSLTVRGRGLRKEQPIRVVLDTHARMPLNARMLDGSPVWVMVGRNAPSVRVKALEERGACVFRISQKDGRVSLLEVLKILGRKGIVRLLLEGGGEVLGTFFNEKLVHEIFFFIAPMILGGKESIRAVAGEGARCWKKSLNVTVLKIQRCGVDLLVRGTLI